MLWTKNIPAAYCGNIALRALQGAILGSGAPIGWALIQLSRGIDPLSDITANTLLYLYMLFGTALAFGVFGAHLGHHECFLKENSWRDPLTKLYNLRYFKQQLSQMLLQANRDTCPLSLIYFDIDHFKRVNDEYGHSAGDKVLKAVAESVETVLRRNELFARIGGEEFAVIVPRGDIDAAKRLAERIRETVARKQVTIAAQKSIRVTISLGVICAHNIDTADDLVDQADIAMYQAKRDGRNRVYAA